MGIKQRRQVANYLDVAAVVGTPDFAFMGSGFIDLNDSPSAQVIEKKYIINKGATSSVASYTWSAPYTFDQSREEEVIDFICAIGEEEKTGADCERDYVIVEMSKKIGTTGTEYEAKKRMVVIEVAEFANNDGEMQGSGNLLSASDWVLGKFDTTTRTFTATVI